MLPTGSILSYSLFLPIFELSSSMYFEICQFSDFQCGHLVKFKMGFERLDEQSEYNEIVQLVLDCTAYDPDESHTHDTAWLALESHAREYCYELHRLRYAAVKELRGSQPCRSRPLLRTA